jgi:molybdenum cofactor cytidylyltransferase
VQLIEALRFQQGTSMAFVGAGGKSTAMFTTARELSANQRENKINHPILVTTTTHLGSWQAELADRTLLINSAFDVSRLGKDLQNGITLLIGGEENNRLTGPTTRLLNQVYRLSESYHISLLIEADGSKTRPLKAPANHEPVIPGFINTVVVVAGLTGLTQPCSSEWVHRPEIFAKLSGLHPGDLISVDAIVKYLRNKGGGLKKIPSKARRVLLLNQADTISLQSQGREISDQLTQDYHSIVIASLNRENGIGENKNSKSDGDIHAVVEQIAGIVLAAGGSSRYGEPKQLLQWKKEPIIRHVINSAIKAGLYPIVLVVGSASEEVENVVTDMPVRIVENHNWMTGISSSIREGLRVLPKKLGGTVFLHADQPQVSPILIKSMIEIHQKTLYPIIAPQINGQSGTPVLFDATTFKELNLLQGDNGGKAIFTKYPVEWIPWHDENQLLDIDTPTDYQKFLETFQ